MWSLRPNLTNHGLTSRSHTVHLGIVHTSLIRTHNKHLRTDFEPVYWHIYETYRPQHALCLILCVFTKKYVSLICSCLLCNSQHPSPSHQNPKFRGFEAIFRAQFKFALNCRLISERNVGQRFCFSRNHQPHARVKQGGTRFVAQCLVRYKARTRRNAQSTRGLTMYS